MARLAIGGWRWALVFAAFASLLAAGPAAAAPVAYYNVPGGGNQPIGDLTAASDGTLWVAQRLSWGPSNTERHMRLLHFDASGGLLAATPDIEGDPIFTEMAAANDGGLWAITTGALLYVSPVGSIAEVPTPERTYFNDLVPGSDGRAWVRACKPASLGDLYSEECEVVAASPNGSTQTFPAPELDIVWPAGAKSMWSTSRAIPTANGTWISRLFIFENETKWSSHVAYYSHSGAASTISLPANSYLTEPAGGDAAWWLREEGTGGATIGEADTAGLLSNTQHLANVSAYEPPDGYNTAAGANGNLIWAQNATWSETLDGQLGVRRPDGSSAVFPVAKNASAVSDSSGTFWSGSCVLGTRLYEAADGSIWTLSFGHPSRVTRQQPGGDFSVFLIGDEKSREEEEEIGIYSLDGLVATNQRSLWFTRNLDGVAQLAKIDPLDPPPPEPRYTGGRATDPRLTMAQRIQRLLRSLMTQSRRGFTQMRSHWLDRAEVRRGHAGQPPRAERLAPLELRGQLRQLGLRGRFPIDGSATVRLETGGAKGRGAGLLVAAGSKSGPAGVHALTVRLFKRGGALMRRSSLRSQPLVISVSFQPKRGATTRRSVSLRLR